MRKKPECPICREQGNIDSSNFCNNCNNQLEYADLDGTLRTARTQNKCPRCSTVNPTDVRYCESCGMQISNFCGYCKKYHSVEDAVCPKTCEPVKSEKQPSEPASAISKIMVTASIFAMLFLGFLIYKASHKPEACTTFPVKYVLVTPVGTATDVPAQNVKGRPAIDVVFCIDSTGSMGDEIDVVKREVSQMIKKIASGQPQPYVRYGLVVYRDRGDSYITRKFALTDSIAEISQNLSTVEASGGGDTEESVNEALHTSVNCMNWDKSANTEKMVFLIGDAGPHMDYANDYNYKTVCSQAKNKGIKIFTIGCSGINTNGNNEFQEIAQLTNGSFDYLTYQQELAQADGTKVKYLSAGDKVYKVTGGKDDEWKGGYADMVKNNRACEVSKEEMPSAPACAASTTNNLDTMMTKQVQNEAKEKGVVYKEDK